MRKAQKLVVLALLAAMTVSCSSNSRRAEIDARKAALQHKQDSTLEATKLELARADSILEALNREYAEKEAIVQKHRENSPPRNRSLPNSISYACAAILSKWCGRRWEQKSGILTR